MAEHALIDALGLARGPGLVSLVGGGGKSSLLFALGARLPGRVVLTTTTRIFAAQIDLADRSCSLEDPDWEARLVDGPGASLLIGSVEGERAVGVPRELPGRLLARPDIDWVVVEADGSRMLPVKAPADHEPVVPDETQLLVVVAGIDALSRPVAEIAHRPELVSGLTGVALHECLTPDTLATLLTSQRGGCKHAPAGCRIAVMLNKVESAADRALARATASAVMRNGAIERVVSGALRLGPSARFEVFSR